MLRDIIACILVAYILFNILRHDDKFVEILKDTVGSGVPQCPHKTYIFKHLCQNCSSEEDALAFSKERVSVYPTYINGVLFGSNNESDWEVVTSANGEKDLCKNKYGWMHFTCNLKTNRCRKNGMKCFTWHHISNGHFFYKKIKC